MRGRLGDSGQYQARQHVIRHTPWDAQRAWTHLRTVARIRTGILAIEDTGFPKQGTAWVGVQRQDCGALGKIGICQVAVSSALSPRAARGRWPATCICRPRGPRTPSAGTPTGFRPQVQFREKWRIALAQVRAIQQAGLSITGVVVVADYGTNAAFRAGLERLGLAYGVAIRGEAVSTVSGVDHAPLSAKDLPTSAARRRVGDGNVGGRHGQRASVRCACGPPTGRGDRWLLCERSATDVRNYYLLKLPATPPLEDLVTLARSRWPIEAAVSRAQG